MPDPMRQLQRAAGNRAVCQLLAAPESRTRLQRKKASDKGKSGAKRKRVRLDFLRIKRLDTHVGRKLAADALESVGLPDLAARAKKGTDSYGHWWVEIGALGRGDPAAATWRTNESYGWWPEHDVGPAETLKLPGFRVDGALNQGERRDPHHAGNADHQVHPTMEVAADTDYREIRDVVVHHVRLFAKGFQGSWNWRLAWGKNCHTFIDRLKKVIGLRESGATEWLRPPGH